MNKEKKKLQEDLKAQANATSGAKANSDLLHLQGVPHAQAQQEEYKRNNNGNWQGK